MHVVSIEFTARRYHATPWDAHVNEGRVEWPPCPWRLLRAWLAVGYNKMGWSDEPPIVASSLLNKLSECDPRYLLPRATEAHTRHYMPARSGSKEKKVKVFDSFIRCTNDDQRLCIRYDVSLNDEELATWKELVAGMAYLGRAESWVEAELSSFDAADEDGRQWLGLADDSNTEDHQRVRLLSPIPSREYQSWRSEEVERVGQAAVLAAAAKAESNDKKFTPSARKKALANAEAPFPPSLLDCLQQDNAKWQREGWPRPPGSQWQDFVIPENVLERSPLLPISHSMTFRRPDTILLSIDGEGKRGTLRPRTHRALPLMDLLHSEAVRHAADLGLGHLPELTGTHEDGSPLNNAHLHAHWLPLSLLSKQHVDHVLVYAHGGFSRPALQAVSAIRWAYAKGINALSINMVGRGEFKEIAEQLRNADGDLNATQVMGPGKVWESATPLVLRKYLHRRGKKTVEGQIREELKERGFPVPVSVTVWSPQDMVRRKLKGYVLRRKPTKRQPPMARSWAATIEFSDPVVNRPLSLGYASHFGLGMFKVADI